MKNIRISKQGLSYLYDELSKWDVRRSTFDNPVAGFVLVCFLKFISDNKEMLNLNYQDKFQYDSLLDYGEKLTVEDLVTHIADVELQLGFDKGILDSFAKDLPLLGEESVMCDLFQKIKEIDFTVHARAKYDVYEELVKYLDAKSRSGLRFEGQYFTDLRLSKLMSKILDVQENKTVYDFAVGYGISLIESTKNMNATIYAQEVDKIAAAISIMMLVMSMNTQSVVNCENTITEPMTMRYGIKFDRVIAAPPLNIKVASEDARLKSGAQAMAFEYELADKLSGDLVFARHLLAALKKDGMGVLLMPISALYRGANDNFIRKKMVEDNFIDAVIELPTGILMESRAKTALVIFKKNKIDRNIYMIDLSREKFRNYFKKVGRTGATFTEEGVEFIANVITEREVIESASSLVPYSAIADNRYVLSPHVYLETELINVIETEDTIALKQKNARLLNNLQNLDFKMSELIEQL